MKLGFEMSGDLAKSLNAMSDPVKKDALYDALFEGAEPIRSRMGQLAKRGDEAPHMADNMVIAKAKKVDGVRLHEDEAAVAIGPRPSFFYAFFVEFGLGTLKMAQPFARPAYDEMRGTALSIVGARLWDVVRGKAKSSTSGRGL